MVSGWNCTAQSVYAEMRLTKERYRKTDGRQYYHFVQSFGEQDSLTPQELHAMGLELARREFPDFEVLVATHVDTAHPHNHLLVNSVSFQDGRKLHQSAADLQAHRLASDQICAAHGLEILPPPQRRVRQKRIGTREYRSAAKGQSWKFRLMNAIDQCMGCAATREEFISLMESEGYQVRWTAGRKNITYTTPGGMRCRDDRLHEEKYTKEVMEHEFRIRAEIVHRGTEAVESNPDYLTHGGSCATGIPNSAGVGRAAGPAEPSGGRCYGTGGPHTGVGPTGGTAPHPGTVGDTGTGGDPDTGGVETGWEEERDLYLAAQFGIGAVGDDLAGPDFAGGHGWDGGLADDLVRLGRALERSANADPVTDATTTHLYTDHRLLQKERQKRSPSATKRTTTRKNQPGSRPCAERGLLIAPGGQKEVYGEA